jgi:Flp pilus assembly protein TadD
VQAVRGALGAEEGVSEGGGTRAVGPDVSGTHERARGGAAEVDRAQVAHVQGQVGLPVRRDAVGLARARAIAGKGIAEWMLGGIEDAVAHLNEAVELADRLDDDWLTGISICSLGAIRSQQGRHEQAFEHHATALALALALAEKNGRPRAITNALCFAADNHLAVGRYAEAKNLLRRAAELAREAEDLPLRAASLSRLATVEHIQGSLHSAVDTHHRALAALTPHTSAGLEMEVRIRLGSTYAAAGRRAEARQEFRTALSLPGAGDHPRQFARARDGLSGIGFPAEESA